MAPPIQTVFTVGMELRGLCSRRERLKVEVNVIKCHAVKRGVRLATVVECNLAGDPSFGRSHGVVGVQIVLFVLDRLPQSLDELSRHAPRPSMLMQIVFFCNTLMKLKTVVQNRYVGPIYKDN
jgi:hypothetical protein